MSPRKERIEWLPGDHVVMGSWRGFDRRTASCPGAHTSKDGSRGGLATLLVIGILCSVADALDTSQCIAPMGMESGAIRDEDITASSSFDSGNVGPQHARVRLERNGGAWCPKHQITKEPKEWLEIDLRRVHVVTATETQGRFGNGQGQEFSEAYMLEYWRPRLGKWVRYRNAKGDEVIQGNTNTYLAEKRALTPPMLASRLRFLPYSYHRRTVCMRVEFYGCEWLDGIVSYTMPQGDKRGTGWEFYDATYDGFWDGALLRNGMGQLTDGRVGPENFKMAYYDHERGQGWVGWRNDTRNGQAVEITFEFDEVREFSALHIYANNQFTRDIQVFSEARVFFSVGGRRFPGEPITYAYIEDRIFEHSRNVSIKLHHRVGRYVRIQLYFAAKWIMISEVSFASDVAHGNFSVEPEPSPEPPVVMSDVYVEKEQQPQPNSNLPVSRAGSEEQPYMAVIIGVLTAVILLLAVAIFLIVVRHRHRKNFPSPLGNGAKAPLTPIPMPPAHPAEKDKGGSSCKDVVVDDNYNQPRNALLPPIPKGTIFHPPGLEPSNKTDDYQEPYQALKYAPYYSYSTIVMDFKDNCLAGSAQSDLSYDYAVPETSQLPLLSPETPVSVAVSSGKGSLLSKASSASVGTGTQSDDSKERKSPGQSQSQGDLLAALRQRLQTTVVHEFPRHRLRMLRKLADGAFGTVYIAEADAIPEYGTTASIGKRLVAVKFLLSNASEKEKLDFHKEVRILATLQDPHIARVLGMCSREEPLCVIMEYLEGGDLTQFLRLRRPQPATQTQQPTPTHTSLSFGCLIYMATQIASGMRYLEGLNFVHRDLSTRNCLVGNCYHIKISDFGTDNEAYVSDYFRVDGKMALPVRWMAWESMFLGKYTTKSDVWAFAVTLWEILTFAHQKPYDGLSNEEVIENLRHLQTNDGEFEYLPRPPNCSKDIFDLACECWRRNDVERPSFREIHLFLQRKNLGYAPD